MSVPESHCSRGSDSGRNCYARSYHELTATYDLACEGPDITRLQRDFDRRRVITDQPHIVQHDRLVSLDEHGQRCGPHGAVARHLWLVEHKLHFARRVEGEPTSGCNELPSSFWVARAVAHYEPERLDRSACRRIGNVRSRCMVGSDIDLLGPVESRGALDRREERCLQHVFRVAEVATQVQG